jgi:uncharacterized protein YyaL (SSP411 family)
MPINDSLDEATVAFLDDYANIIDGFIAIRSYTFDEEWLQQAKKLTDSRHCPLL